METVKIATCQFPVSPNICRNLRYMKRMIRQAADQHASIVHFPETALSGYGGLHTTANKSDRRRSLEDAIDEMVDLGSNLGLWVVFGSSRMQNGKSKPVNSVYVASGKGELFTYDKRKLTPAESEWYEPGGGNDLVIEINGIRCGFLICYEASFPDLWKAYESQGVRLIFHSSHNVSRRPQHLLQEVTLAQVRTRATDHKFWIFHSNSSAKYSFSTAFVTKPNGSITKLPKHKAGILFVDVPKQETIR